MSSSHNYRDANSVMNKNRPRPHQQHSQPPSTEVPEQDASESRRQNTQHQFVVRRALDSDKAHFCVITNPSGGSLQIPLADVDTPKLREALATRLGHQASKAELAQIRTAAAALNGTKPEVRLITRIEHDGERFFTPFGVFPEPEGQQAVLVFEERYSPSDLASLKMKGDLASWRALEDDLRGNSRLIFAVCLAFAGPIGALAGRVPLSFVFVGEHGTGKTVCGRIASSVWGWSGSNFGSGTTFNNTSLALQSFIASRHLGFAFIDEMNGLNVGNRLREFLGSGIFVIEAGKGRSRKTAPGSGGMMSPQDPNWIAAALFTSNDSVIHLGQKAGVQIDGQHLDRFIDIPQRRTSGTFFESEASSDEVIALAARCDKICAQHHGVAGKIFLQRLARVWINDRASVEKNLQRWESIYLEAAAKRLGVDAGSRRSRSFARVYVAGRAAIRCQVLSLTPDEVLDAVLSCHRGHLKLNVSAANKRNSPAEAVARFKDWCSAAKKLPLLQDAQASRLRTPADTCFRSREKGSELVLIPPSTFAQIAGGAAGAELLKAELQQSGLLHKVRNGRSGSMRSVHRRKVNEYGEIRYFLVLDLDALRN